MYTYICTAYMYVYTVHIWAEHRVDAARDGLLALRCEVVDRQRTADPCGRHPQQISRRYISAYISMDLHMHIHIYICIYIYIYI